MELITSTSAILRNSGPNHLGQWASSNPAMSLSQHAILKWFTLAVTSGGDECHRVVAKTFWPGSSYYRTQLVHTRTLVANIYMGPTTDSDVDVEAAITQQLFVTMYGWGRHGKPKG